MSSIPPDLPQTLYSFTAEVLDRRSRRYRNLVVAVALVGLVAPVAALALWDWRPLLGWLSVVPFVGLFLALDARSVARWRSALLDGWAAGTFDLDALREGVAAIKTLPAGTVAGMLDPLPTRARLGCFPDPPPLIREALAATVRAIDTSLLRRMAAGVVALTTTVALLGSAAAFGSAWPLVGLPLTVGLGRLARGLGSHPPPDWGRRVTEMRRCGLDVPTFTTLAARLAWDPLPTRARDQWLRIVASG